MNSTAPNSGPGGSMLPFKEIEKIRTSLGKSARKMTGRVLQKPDLLDDDVRELTTNTAKAEQTEAKVRNAMEHVKARLDAREWFSNAELEAFRTVFVEKREDIFGLDACVISLNAHAPTKLNAAIERWNETIVKLDRTVHDFAKVADEIIRLDDEEDAEAAAWAAKAPPTEADRERSVSLDDVLSEHGLK